MQLSGNATQTTKRTTTQHTNKTVGLARCFDNPQAHKTTSPFTFEFLYETPAI
eukprot:m.257172 g.257172  ORF g.257172 m.257172 type:complete len:53 (-) comp35026_c0_seq1:139-297(-)